MLTLTRKVGERIQVGDDITIEVREIRRSQVRIGIVAPKEIPINREELLGSTRSGGDEDSEPEEPFEPPVIIRRGHGK